MSYKIAESKWLGTREAFHDFNADRVARITPSEIDQLTEDIRVVRNRRKLEAVVGEEVPDHQDWQANLKKR